MNLGAFELRRPVPAFVRRLSIKGFLGMGGNRRSGRRRTSTDLKLVRGTFRPDRHADEAQPTAKGWPDPPGHLSARERVLWDALRTHCEPWSAPSDWVAYNGVVSLLDRLLRVQEAMQANTDAQAASKLQGLEVHAVELHATDLMGLTFGTNRLITDSRPALAMVLERGFRDAVGGKMLRERIAGKGVGEPLGVLHSPARIFVAKESGQQADTINYLNVSKMAERCYGFDQAVWLANHDTRRQLTAIVQSDALTSIPRYQCATADGEPDRLLGRPVFYTEVSPALGEEGDLILVNPSEYLDGILRPGQMTESIHVRFLANETAFRFWLRGDGAPWWLSVLTPEFGANTLSPYVVLAERA
jgi:hypothetical protein